MHHDILSRVEKEIRSSLRKNKNNKQMAEEHPLEQALKRCDLYFCNLHNFANCACDYRYFLKDDPQFTDFNDLLDYIESDELMEREEKWKNQMKKVQYDIAPYHLEYVRRSFINLDEGTKILPYLLAAYYINSHDDMAGALACRLGEQNPVSLRSDLEIFTERNAVDSQTKKKRQFLKRFSLEDYYKFSPIKRYFNNWRLLESKFLDNIILRNNNLFNIWSNCIPIDVPKERNYNKYVGDLRYLALHFNAVILLIVFALCCKACTDIPELAIDIELSAEMFLEHTHLLECLAAYSMVLCNSDEDMMAILSDKDDRLMPLITNVVECSIPTFLYHHTIDINDIYSVLFGSGKIRNFWWAWSRLSKEGEFLFCKNKLWIPQYIDMDSNTFTLPTKLYDFLVARREQTGQDKRFK